MRRAASASASVPEPSSTRGGLGVAARRAEQQRRARGAPGRTRSGGAGSAPASSTAPRGRPPGGRRRPGCRACATPAPTARRAAGSSRPTAPRPAPARRARGSPPRRARGRRRTRRGSGPARPPAARGSGPGIPMPSTSTPQRRPDLDREQRQAERDAEPAIEDAREQRVLGGVVGVAIAGEAEPVEQQVRAAPRCVGSSTCAASSSSRPCCASMSRVGSAWAAISSSASSTGSGWSCRATSAAKRAVASSTMGPRYRRYLAAHVPRELRRHRPRPPRRGHGHQRRGGHLPPARRGGEPPLPRAARAPGSQPGDHVALCLENSARFLPVIWGCHYAGLYYTAMSSRLTTEEMAYILDDCGAQAFITSAYKADQAAELRRPDAGREGAADARRRHRRLRALRGRPRRPTGHARSTRSGSRARTCSTAPAPPAGPKGVKVAAARTRRSARGPTASPALAQLLFSAPTSRPCTSPPRRCTTPPRCASAEPTHRLGGTVIVMEHFDPEQYLALVEQHRVTFSQVVPTMFIRMLKLPDEVRARYDLSSLQVVVHAAAPCPAEVKAQIIDWFGPIIHEYYAGTEGNGFVYCNSERLARPPRHGGPVDPRHRPHRRRRRRGGAHRRVRHRVLRRRGGVDVRVPQRRREDGQLARPEGSRLEHARRRRLPRRGRLPLPHRSQGLHDHHRRRERVPAGGRERARPPPEGERRRRVRRAQRRLRRRGEGRRRAGVDGRRPAPTSSASSSRTARSTSPT